MILGCYWHDITMVLVLLAWYKMVLELLALYLHDSSMKHLVFKLKQFKVSMVMELFLLLFFFIYLLELSRTLSTAEPETPTVGDSALCFCNALLYTPCV